MCFVFSFTNKTYCSCLIAKSICPSNFDYFMSFKISFILRREVFLGFLCFFLCDYHKIVFLVLFQPPGGLLYYKSLLIFKFFFLDVRIIWLLFCLSLQKLLHTFPFFGKPFLLACQNCRFYFHLS